MCRSNCSIQTLIGNEIYCGFYDDAYQTCQGIEFGKCPDGLDDEDIEDDYSDHECQHCFDSGCVFCEGY